MSRHSSVTDFLALRTGLNDCRDSRPQASLVVSALWSTGDLAPALILPVLVQVFTVVQTQLYFAVFGFEISFLAWNAAFKAPDEQ